MRKVYLFNMVTLDGFFEGLDHDINWHNADEEFNDFAIQQLNQTGLILFGRVTYEMMASFWPSEFAIQTDPVVAGLMNSFPKVVFSTTLQSADWNNTRLVKNNAAQEIARLKAESGRDIAIFGSAKLASSLFATGLIDEYRLILNPLVLGAGTPLFKPADEKLKMKLVNSRIFKSGNVLLYYQPVSNP